MAADGLDIGIQLFGDFYHKCRNAARWKYIGKDSIEEEANNGNEESTTVAFY